MVNKSKNKGTAAETAVTRYARAIGFPLADRRPLKGSSDEGDILLTAGLIAEVKAGKAAQLASVGQIDAWWNETVIERVNANADHALLIVQRRGVGLTRVGMWDCYQVQRFGRLNGLICTTLIGGLLICREQGWGDPL